MKHVMKTGMRHKSVTSGVLSLRKFEFILSLLLIKLLPICRAGGVINKITAISFVNIPIVAINKAFEKEVALFVSLCSRMQ